MTFIRVIWGRMASSEDTNRVLLIIQNWKELQTWAWFDCVRLVMTYSLICNMIHLGQHVTPSDLELRSNFDLTFQGQQVYVNRYGLISGRRPHTAAEMSMAARILPTSNSFACRYANVVPMPGLRNHGTAEIPMSPDAGPTSACLLGS